MKRQSAQHASPPAPAHVPRVLVADADEDTRALYRQSFEFEGYAVTEAADGRDALIQALLRPPAIVVAELVLPYIDGLALCEVLRADRQTATIPILIVTADARPEQLARVRQAGGNALLVKPVSIDDLLAGIRRLVTPHPAEGADVPLDPEGSDGEAAVPPERPRTLVKALPRFATTAPPIAPLNAICPSCDLPLKYRRSQLGGVSKRYPEQWDYFVCESCGCFQYRHRTRKLTPCAD